MHLFHNPGRAQSPALRQWERERSMLLMGIWNLNWTSWFRVKRILISLDMPIFKIHILGPNLCDFKIYPLIRPHTTDDWKGMSLEVADSGWEPKMLFCWMLMLLLPPFLGMWHSVTLEFSALLSTPNTDDIWATGRPSGIKEWILSLEDLDPGMPNPSETCEQAYQALIA